MKYYSRRGCVTLFFIICLALYIVDISVVSHEIHWWNNRNISFILNNLNLANSGYDKHSTAYLLYRILKTRIKDVCAFPPDSLSEYKHITTNSEIHYLVFSSSYKAMIYWMCVKVLCSSTNRNPKESRIIIIQIRTRLSTTSSTHWNSVLYLFFFSILSIRYIKINKIKYNGWFNGCLTPFSAV